MSKFKRVYRAYRDLFLIKTRCSAAYISVSMMFNSQKICLNHMVFISSSYLYFHTWIYPFDCELRSTRCVLKLSVLRKVSLKHCKQFLMATSWFLSQTSHISYEGYGKCEKLHKTKDWRFIACLGKIKGYGPSELLHAPTTYGWNASKWTRHVENELWKSLFLRMRVLHGLGTAVVRWVPRQQIWWFKICFFKVTQLTLEVSVMI